METVDLAEMLTGDAAASELLRLVTCGSVDDGKSTLIGRLLYDTKQVMADQLEHVEETSERRGDGYVNLALLTDGLRAEREQGITIDVAYRSFVTPTRRFQLADAPGHVQYTRNMVTGASTADVAVVLLDARKGVIEQTQRHTYIASMLGIPHVVFAVNKLDLVDFDESRFRTIEADLEELAARLALRDSTTVPIAALPGENVVSASERMPWWSGPTFLELLERIEIAGDRDVAHRRFPVQWVIRPMSDAHHDYRGYAGQVAGGEWRAGDDVVVLPSGRRSAVASVETVDGPIDVAVQGQSVVVRLADDVDVARGDMLGDPADPPAAARELEARVCWMSERPVQTGARLAVKHTTRWTRAILDEVVSVLDVETLDDRPAGGLGLNDLAHIRLRLAEPLLVDPYAENRATGAFVLVDEATNETVGAGMVLAASG
jgi:sulfate adenylyltransferase subunit 1